MTKTSFFIFVILNFCGIFLWSQSIAVNNLKNKTEISINEFASFFYSHYDGNKLITEQISDPANFIMPRNAKAIWLVFDLKDNKADSLFIYTKSQIAKLDLFQKKNNEIIKIGHTGFANSISTASVRGVYNNISIPKNSSGRFYLKISPERYDLELNSIYLSPLIFYNKESENISNITLVTTGFEICIFLTVLIFWVLNFRKKISKILLFFLLLNFTDTIYLLSRYYVVILEVKGFDFTNSNIWNIIGDINIFLYYLFYFYFFKIPFKSIAGYFVAIGVVFWTIQIFIELSDFHSVFWINFAVNYLNSATIVDFVILLAILVHVIRFRIKKNYYLLGMIGLIFMLLSSFELAYPHFFATKNWISINYFSFQFMQICILLNILCFIAAILYKNMISEREKLNIKQKLLYNEIERQKSIQHERERISHDMHDDLGAGISAIKLQAEFLKEKSKNNPSFQKDLDELLKTSSEMNLSMREMLWNLNKTNDTLNQLIQYIGTYADNFFNKTKVKLTIQNNLSSFDCPISSEVRWHLFLCVKEALNNIYKHSNATNVVLKFEFVENEFILGIKDDGVGLYKTLKEGNGFKNMHYRMQESCGNFEIIPSENGLQVKFSFKILV